jgi:hypothetical protein
VHSPFSIHRVFYILKQRVQIDKPAKGKERGVAESHGMMERWNNGNRIAVLTLANENYAWNFHAKTWWSGKSLYFQLSSIPIIQ